MFHPESRRSLIVAAPCFLRCEAIHMEIGRFVGAERAEDRRVHLGIPGPSQDRVNESN